jgi:hypothetical protein
MNFVLCRIKKKLGTTPLWPTCHGNQAPAVLPAKCPTENVTFFSNSRMHCSNIPKTSNPSHNHQLANEAKTTHIQLAVPAVIELSSILELVVLPGILPLHGRQLMFSFPT